MFRGVENCWRIEPAERAVAAVLYDGSGSRTTIRRRLRCCAARDQAIADPMAPPPTITTSACISNCLQGKLGGCQIFECAADALEERDVGGRRTAVNRASNQLGEFTPDVLGPDGTASERVDQLTGLGQRADPGININRGSLDGQRVDFAHVRPKGADQIQMLPGSEPLAFDERLSAQGSSAYDLRPTHTGFQIGADPDV